MDRKTRRGCLWIALGVVVLLVVVGVALIGGFGWFVYQSFSIKAEHATRQTASGEFDRVRARFAAQTPLIAFDEHGVGRVQPRTAPRKGDLEAIHVITYDPDEGRIARFTIPFWLVRLGPDTGTVSFGSGHERIERMKLKVTVGDIERAGAGLLLDHTDPDGGWVLAWTE